MIELLLNVEAPGVSYEAYQSIDFVAASILHSAGFCTSCPNSNSIQNEFKFCPNRESDCMTSCARKSGENNGGKCSFCPPSRIVVVVAAAATTTKHKTKSKSKSASAAAIVAAADDHETETTPIYLDTTTTTSSPLSTTTAIKLLVNNQ